MSILVSVAAYCEPHLEFTLDGLFFRAQDPARIAVAVVDQSPVDNREWLSRKAYWPQIRYVHIDPIDSLGVSWARSIAFSFYRGERYLLQIDSHTHFDEHWDRRLIDTLMFFCGKAEKPIVSTYPPPFEFDESGQPFKKLTPRRTVLALRPHPETSLSEESATLRFRAEHVRGAEYVEGYHLSAGFLFTLGRFVEEIPYDPFMYFHGEEQNLAIRAYTHGWTIFHPLHEWIPIYHLYKQKDAAHTTHHWHADYEARRTVKWTELKRRSDARLRDLVYHGRTGGAYGLGTVRTVSQFSAASGIDYVGRRIRDPAMAAEPSESVQPVDGVGTASDEERMWAGHLREQVCRHGRFLFPARDQYIGRSMHLYGEWCEPKVTFVSGLLHPGDVVVEVGSNLGCHTVPLARLVGEQGSVIAFEPQQSIFQLLCANLLRQEIDNVSLHNCAVGRSPGVVKVPVLPLGRAYNFGAVRVHTGTGEGASTPLVSIDSLDLKRLDLLKISAGGFEPDVLLGAMATIDRCHPVIMVEYNPDVRDRVDRVLRLFDGYTAWWLKCGLFCPDNWRRETRNVFGATVSLNLILAPGGCDLSWAKLTPHEPASRPGEE